MNKDGFLADLEEATGISPDQLSWDVVNGHKCVYPGGSVYPKAIGRIPKKCSDNKNYAMPHLARKFPVSNPKEIISACLPDITAFGDLLALVVRNAGKDLYSGSTIDVVDGASLLVFMVSNSIASMKSVEEIGEKYHKEKVERTILLFVSALLLLIPGLGEIADSFELAFVASTLRAIGVAGEVGVNIYGAVSAEDSGPGEIFSSLLGGLRIPNIARAPANFARAARAMRAMDPGDIAKFGEQLREGMGQIDKLKQLCR
ncbi:hypothetical protein BDV19DRAFT_359256 [Aspergillus venezuelensis]